MGAGDPALPPVSPPSVLATAAATATSTAPGKKGGAAKGGGKAADGDKNNEGPPPLFEAKEGQVRAILTTYATTVIAVMTLTPVLTYAPT